MIPRGKGVFIWKIYSLEGSTIDQVDYDAIVDAIVGAGITHVYIKIADGTYPYNVKWGNYPWWSGGILDDFAKELTVRLHQALVLVIGWQYVRAARPLDEAKIAIDRSNELGLDGFSIDAEAEYKLADKDTVAETYMKELRDGLQDIPISLCSYRYPKVHPELPYAPFLRRCDHVNQQLYWVGSHNPVAQLDWSMKQYEDLMKGIGIELLPQTPVGSAYGTSSWRSTPADVQAFLKACVDRKLESASLWSMDWMRKKGLDLWEAMAGFDWPNSGGDPEPEPEFADRIRVVANVLGKAKLELLDIADSMEN